MEKHNLDYKHRIDTLETIVLKKNDKDDAFERIHQKISEQDSGIKQSISTMESTISQIQDEIGRIHFWQGTTETRLSLVVTVYLSLFLLGRSILRTDKGLCRSERALE